MDTVVGRRTKKNRWHLLLDTTTAAVEGRRKSCFRFASSGSDDFGGFRTENQFDDLFPPWSMIHWTQ